MGSKGTEDTLRDSSHMREDFGHWLDYLESNVLLSHCFHDLSLASNLFLT